MFLNVNSEKHDFKFYNRVNIGVYFEFCQEFEFQCVVLPIRFLFTKSFVSAIENIFPFSVFIFFPNRNVSAFLNH